MSFAPIRFSDIPAEGLSLDYLHERALLEPLGEGVRLLDSVSVSIRITPEQGRFFVEGEVRGQVEVDCDRCLMPVRLGVRAPCAVDLAPHPERGTAGERHALERGDLDVTFVSGPLLNLDDLVREQLLLQIPMRVLCREGCLGLCPNCRKNLNDGPCGCVDSAPTDPRFEALKNVRHRPER
jgi:uncharacterized protein